MIRGVFIKHGARIKKEREHLLLELLQKIQDVELKHKTPTASLETELMTLSKQTVDLLQYRAKAALQRCCKRSYKSGDKCGKLLAKAVRNLRLNTYIPQIIDPTGQKKTTPTQIAKEFRDYYTSLYNLPVRPPNDTTINEYLSASQIPQLTPETSAELEEPITLEEIQQASKGMKSGKSPGPDGLTLQYYQTLLTILGPHMVRLYNGLSEGISFPRDMLRAHIYHTKGRKGPGGMWQL